MNKKILALVCAVAMTTGCAGKISTKAEKSSDAAMAKTEAVLDAHNYNLVKDNGGIKKTDVIWVSAKKVSVNHEKAPDWINYEFVNIVKAKGSLQEAVNAINLGLKDGSVYISDDLEQYLKTDKSKAELDLLQYSGSFKDFLDKVTEQTGSYWRTKDGKVEIYLTDTKTFPFKTMVGETAVNSGVKTTSGGGGGMDSSYSYKNNLWKDITDSVKSLLSSKGKMVSTAGLGTITITDTPDRMAIIEDVIKNINNDLNKQISFNVRIVSIKDEGDEGSSFDIAAIYKALSGSFQISMANAIPGLTGGSSLTGAILSPTSAWNGSSAILGTLNKTIKAKTEMEITGSTPNNLPLPISQSTDTSFIKEITPQTTNATTGVVTPGSITPGTISTGLYIMLLPKVINDHQVLLQVSIEQSELVNLKKEAASTGANSMQIQTPEISKTSLLQRVPVNSGDTLMISGITRERLTSTDQTVAPGTAILGGNNSGVKTKDRLLIFITPAISEIN